MTHAVDIESFVERGSREACASLHSWYSPNERRANFRDEVQAAVERIRGASSDAGGGVIEVEPGRVAICEIVGDDPSRGQPYLRVTARDFAIDSRSLIESLRSSLSKTFRARGFERALVYVSRRSDAEDFRSATELSRFPGAIAEKRYLAAKLSDLRQNEKPNRIAKVSARRATTLEFYPSYDAAYDEFHAERPDLRIVVPKEPIERLEEFMTAGAIYETFIEDAWSGIIAVVPEVEVGLRGWKFVERLTVTRFRGQGLGPATLRAFVDAFDERDLDVIYGMIHAENGPSYRSAQRFGRTDIGGWFWLPLG